MQQNYQRSAAQFFVLAFGVVILAISAVTTFSFFSTYFAAIFPAGMLGAELASLMAGGAGVILFDLAAVYWLNTFLHHAETSEQRGIALILLVVTFTGAAAASIAQLGLAASGDVALDEATRQSIANMSVWTVIIGVVINFGANIAYGRYSLASKEAVMEADHRDIVQAAEDEQARMLHHEVARKVKELIEVESDNLAREEASYVVSKFRRQRRARYTNENAAPPPPATAASEPPRAQYYYVGPDGHRHYRLELDHCISEARASRHEGPFEIHHVDGRLLEVVARHRDNDLIGNGRTDLSRDYYPAPNLIDLAERNGRHPNGATPANLTSRGMD